MYRFYPSKGVKAIQKAFTFREFKKCLKETLFIGNRLINFTLKHPKKINIYPYAGQKLKNPKENM